MTSVFEEELDHLGLANNVEGAKACRRVWDNLLLDNVANVSRLVASEIFDTAVNCGDGNAVMFLQRSLNAFNRQGQDYSAVRVDGVMGAATLHALAGFIEVRKKRGETVLLKALNSLHAEYRVRTVQRHAQDDAVFTWIDQRVAL